MRGIAKPKYFLLNLGKSSKAQFHRQVAARDHDRDRPQGAGGDDELRQILDRAR